MFIQFTKEELTFLLQILEIRKNDLAKQDRPFEHHKTATIEHSIRNQEAQLEDAQKMTSPDQKLSNVGDLSHLVRQVTNLVKDFTQDDGEPIVNLAFALSRDYGENHWVSNSRPKHGYLQLTGVLAQMRPMLPPVRGYWTEPSKGVKGVSSYSHVILSSPLGNLIIEWAHWKTAPSYTVSYQENSRYIGAADSLELAKEVAMSHLREKYEEMTLYVVQLLIDSNEETPKA